MHVVALLVVLLAATAARADQKIQSFIPFYEKELSGCQVQRNGMEKVATGAAALAKTLAGVEREEIEKDADSLAKGHALFVEYCSDLESMLGYLKEQANATYRSAEREIDTRDNKIRKLRRDAKKLLEDLGPVTRKLIPRIARVPVAAPDTKRTPAKFPSGRGVELPVLPGTWKSGGTATTDTLAYADKAATASVTTRVFTGATCEQQKRSVAKDNVTDIEPPKDAAVAWAVRSIRKERSGGHVVVTACAQRGGGGIMALADIAPDTAAIADDITRLAFRMLAAHPAESKKTTTPP